MPAITPRTTERTAAELAVGLGGQGAHAPSELDIGLLQKRLNDLDTDIRISIA